VGCGTAVAVDIAANTPVSRTETGRVRISSVSAHRVASRSDRKNRYAAITASPALKIPVATPNSRNCIPSSTQRTARIATWRIPTRYRIGRQNRLRYSPTPRRKLPGLIPIRARVEGLLVSDFAGRFGEASERLGRWVASGELEHRETVVDGLENAPDAFLGLFDGDNIGKQVVRVSSPDE